jgi:hypothetical protein
VRLPIYESTTLVSAHPYRTQPQDLSFWGLAAYWSSHKALLELVKSSTDPLKFRGLPAALPGLHGHRQG